MLALLLVQSAAVVAFNLFVLAFVARLRRQGCECSASWKRSFITFWSAFKVAWVVALVAFLLAGEPAPGPLGGAVAAAVSLVSIAGLVIALTYVHDLQKCACGKDEWELRLWRALLWVQVAFVAIAALSLAAAAVAVIRTAGPRPLPRPSAPFSRRRK
jgi:hypothetical protein